MYSRPCQRTTPQRQVNDAMETRWHRLNAEPWQCLPPQEVSTIALRYWFGRPGIPAFHCDLPDVEDRPERGIVGSGETIRLWAARLGTHIAAKIRRDRPGPAEKWHLSKVLLRINGARSRQLKRNPRPMQSVVAMMEPATRQKHHTCWRQKAGAGSVRRDRF